MLNKRLAVMIIAVTAMISLVACNSSQVSSVPEENKENVVVSTESLIQEPSTEMQSTEVQIEGRISLTEEQITGETKPIEYSVSYFSLSNEYRAKAEEIFEKYIASGMEEEQAVEQAMLDIYDIIYEEEMAYLTDSSMQTVEYDEDGVDIYYYKWYATYEQEVIDLGVFYVKSGEMTKEEAEQYINDTLQSLAEFYEKESDTTDYSALDTTKNMTKNSDGTYQFTEEFIGTITSFDYFENATDEEINEFLQELAPMLEDLPGEAVVSVMTFYEGGNLHKENETRRQTEGIEEKPASSSTSSSNTSNSNSSNTNSNSSSNSSSSSNPGASENSGSSGNGSAGSMDYLFETEDDFGAGSGDSLFGNIEGNFGGGTVETHYSEDYGYSIGDTVKLENNVTITYIGNDKWQDSSGAIYYAFKRSSGGIGWSTGIH